MGERERKSLGSIGARDGWREGKEGRRVKRKKEKKNQQQLPELGSSIMEDASAGPDGGLDCTSVSAANDTGERERGERVGGGG